MGDRPLVLDREFSHGLLLENLAAEGVNFLIRLRLGSHPPVLVDDTGRRIELPIARNQTVSYRQLYYQGQVPINVIGDWRPGFGGPLWIMTSLEPEAGLKVYQARVKIGEGLKDLKSLLHLDKVMNKSQLFMEKMIAMLLIAYAVGLLVGAAIRDQLFAATKDKRSARLRQRYSELFVLLKQQIRLAATTLRPLICKVQQSFAVLVLGENQPVRTHV